MNRVRSPLVLALLLALALTRHQGLTAQSQGSVQTPGAAQNTRARVGSAGGAATLANVRALLPASSSGGAGFLALGVGLVPPPAEIAGEAGNTGILISVSPPPRGPVTFVIRPSAADLIAAGGNLARLALFDIAARRAYGCRPAGAQVICAAPGVGVYILVSAANAEILPASAVDTPVERIRGPVPLAVGSGVAVALLSASLWLWRERWRTGAAGRNE